MATPIVMPSFGMYTTEGTLVNWLRPGGARVGQGEAILEIETEKAVNPVISPVDGILSQVAATGTLIREQDLLGYILADGESAPQTSGAACKGALSKDVERSEAAPEEGGRRAGSHVKSSPAARRLALERGIDLAAVVGTGPGGRIVEADLRSVVERAPRGNSALSAVGANPRTSTALPEGEQLIPLNTMRRTIGERLRRSIDTAVSLTLAREVAADAFVAARKALSARLNLCLPYDVLFLKLLAVALREHPHLNATIEGDHLCVFDAVSLGLAVAVPGGLVVPVVHRVDTAPLAEILDQVRRLTDQARSNALRSEDLAGGTSTVTNLGAYGVDVFTPILNPPQASILGVGRIAERPVVRNGSLSVGQTCWLCLSFDHRVTDGAPAAGLLEDIAKRMADTNYLCALA